MARGGTSTASAIGFGEAASSPRPATVESWTVTAADVEAWFKTAKQGDRMIYAHGPQLIRGAAAALVGRLVDAHEIISHHKRAADGGFDYVIIRNRVRFVRPPVCDPHMMAVLLVIQEDATSGHRCSSDAEIAALTGLSADQVKWQLKKLEAAKFIVRRFVPTPAEPKFRVVKVVATGSETAMPGEAK